MVVAAVQVGKLAELKAEAVRAARFLRQVELGGKCLGVAVLDDAVIVWSEPAGCAAACLPGGTEYVPVPLSGTEDDMPRVMYVPITTAVYWCAPVVVAARRGLSEDDVVRLLSYDQPTASAVKELAGVVEVLLARYEGEMRESGYGDAADLLRTLVAAASILA